MFFSLVAAAAFTHNYYMVLDGETVTYTTKAVTRPRINRTIQVIQTNQH
jgi:hypothetical protein